jgi:hypothetical protein
MQIMGNIQTCGGRGMNIPDEAVEAAARGMFAEEQCDRRQKLDVESNWRGRLDDRDRDEYRRLSRAALEAAAPYLMAEDGPNPYCAEGTGNE